VCYQATSASNTARQQQLPYAGSCLLAKTNNKTGDESHRDLCAVFVTVHWLLFGSAAPLS
jgi:hypothetical protein